MLAIGSERYVPYQQTTAPQELLTQANAILGQGQMSLAKYLWILDEAAAPSLKLSDIETFFITMLERVDWTRDLHFQTKTTIDTLDYSGSGFNTGSKVVVAAAGQGIRKLPTEIPSDLRLPDGFSSPKLCLPGVLAVAGPKFGSSETHCSEPQSERRCGLVNHFCRYFDKDATINQFPLVVIVDDSDFVSRSLNNFLWSVFTRSNPATDIDGIAGATTDKHWGCEGSLVIDARVKPFHAPPLVEDSEISKRVDARATRGDALAKYL